MKPIIKLIAVDSARKLSNLHFILFFLAFLFASTTAPAQVLPGATPAEETTEPEYPEDPLGRRTPRGAVQGFIAAVAQQDYEKASMFLNLPPDAGENAEAERLALVLQRLLDKGELLQYSRISNDPEGATNDELPAEMDKVGLVTVEDEVVDILVEVTEGPDGGPLWLFASETLQSVASADIEDTLLERVLPSFLQDTLVMGVPVGHWLVVLLLIAVAYFLAWGIIKLIVLAIPPLWPHASVDPAAGIIRALALPIRLYLAVWLFVFFSTRLEVSIILRQLFSSLTAIVGAIALLLLFWRLVGFLGTYSKDRMVAQENHSGVSIVLFLQRLAKLSILVIGAIAVLGVFGIDVTAGLAALGIGGIAIALGAQKSVENFVGSVTVIADQPVRVGDFCKVGDVVGTVENIGMRSTRIRTLNRTVVTIPNGKFSSDVIENYAHRDRFLFQTELTFRYETTPDQLRYLLVEIRKILYAHPIVSPEPARIRFVALGQASLNLEIFSYLLVLTYDEFLEVREDLLLRIMDVVEQSGTSFAFPSQTIYLAQDEGLSPQKSEEAAEAVNQWREQNNLPIPKFPPERIEELANSLEYPPEGSVKDKAGEKKP